MRCDYRLSGSSCGLPRLGVGNLADPALDGSLNSAAFRTDPHFGFQVPIAVAGVDAAILDPRSTWADAQAYEIEKINEAVASNPAYIQLQALKALEQISTNPASQIYFLNGESPNPLPLMHMGKNK